MSEGRTKFLNFLAVLLFAGSVVLIGAHELHQRFMKKSSRARWTPEEMVRGMQGDGEVDPVRARFAPGIARKSPEEQDKLAKEDKRDLKQLLDNIIP